jgi:hypothetical protein
VHFAGVDRQRHVVERADSGERLRDAAHLEKRYVHANDIPRFRPVLQTSTGLILWVPWVHRGG